MLSRLAESVPGLRKEKRQRTVKNIMESFSGTLLGEKVEHPRREIVFIHPDASRERGIHAIRSLYTVHCTLTKFGCSTKYLYI